MALKTYVLLEHTHSTANVFLQVNKDQRVRLRNRPLDHAYMQTTFTDREGRNRTIRLKLSTNKIYQDEQIKDGILANQPFSQQEKDAVAFRDGVLGTTNITVQEYLEASPQYDGFWKPIDGKVGYSVDIQRPLYTLHDRDAEIKSDNRAFKTRLAAYNKIGGIENLKEAQDLMIRMFGSFYKAPSTLEECQNALVSAMENASDEALNELLKTDITVDEEITILIGRAIAKGVLSFDAEVDQVSLIKNGQAVSVKQISSEHSLDQRKAYFSEWLTTKAGKLVVADLEKLTEDEVKNVSKQKTLTKTE